MTSIEIAIAGIWLMMPALIPNSAAVLVGGGTPLDLRRSWRGRRILGDGKTWRGFFGGGLAGTAFGTVQIGAVDAYGLEEIWSFGGWPSSLVVVACLAFGSMTGDCLGSFVKRRIGLDRGNKAPGLDQYNFVIGSVAFVLILQPDWFREHFMDGSGILALALIIFLIPILHRGVNIIGYKLGKKNVPW